MRTNGRTRITSRPPARTAVETRITCRAAAASLGGGSRSLLRAAAPLSFAPNAPRNAPSTRSGTLANVISPSSDAKNGAADQSRAAQTCENCTAEPLHGDAAAIDDRGFRSVN